jgi:hypothetical protein
MPAEQSKGQPLKMLELEGRASALPFTVKFTMNRGSAEALPSKLSGEVVFFGGTRFGASEQLFNDF